MIDCARAEAIKRRRRFSFALTHQRPSPVFVLGPPAFLPLGSPGFVPALVTSTMLTVDRCLDWGPGAHPARGTRGHRTVFGWETRLRIGFSLGGRRVLHEPIFSRTALGQH